MPKKYGRKKRTYKRRPMRKFGRRRGPRTNAVVSRSSPLPDRFFTKLRYSDAYTITYAGFQVPVQYLFRVNSIYDPNETGSGHQPLGHDEFLQLYNRYRVYGCKYTITFSNTSTTDYSEASVLLRPNNTALTNQQTIRENNYCMHKITLAPEGSGRSTATVRGYASVAKLRGVSKRAVATENDYGALMGTNPVLIPTLQIYHINATSLGSGSPLYFRIDLEYFTCFSDRKTLAQS